MQTPPSGAAAPPRPQTYQVPSQSLLHFRRVSLNSAVNRGVVDIHIAFNQHLLQLTVADAIFAASANHPSNDASLNMSTFTTLINTVKG
ncbi:hypothetical protein SAMN05216516_101132 [Izhakiella capsodis]|uniref:Uncharacterized protein n=1 Tax=Izhakiella capsodis TaxID=1367852 RepID=A0A1I4UH93_9GAMM|nr:hypothetical protein SAMN05216516_101132 [Izhakiella capsodis]